MIMILILTLLSPGLESESIDDLTSSSLANQSEWPSQNDRYRFVGAKDVVAYSNSASLIALPLF